MKAYIERILPPIVTKKREELKLSSDYPALVIFDKFTGQGAEGVLKLHVDNNIHVVMVSPNCTDRLQSLDMSVNKPAKKFMWQQFHKWYTYQICQQVKQKTTGVQVDLQLSIMKPQEAKWMIQLHDYL